LRASKRGILPFFEDAAMPSRRDTRARFEQWAKNPDCEANTISAVHGVKMADVAVSEGLTPTMGQSPFAIARGQSFEGSLLWNNAERLREALVEAQVIPVQPDGFVDLRMRRMGGPFADLDEALGETTRLLQAVAARRPPTPGAALPSIVAGATVRIPAAVMLPEALLVIDVLTIRYDEGIVVLTVGEIKTYPDRGGYTDGAELATARGQAGVYVHGLDLVVAELGLSDRLRVDRQGFLVLSRPGYNRPSIRAGEDLRYQAKRAERGFAQLEKAASELPPPGTADLLATIRNAATAYCERCVTFCDRAPSCHARAEAQGNPVVLGEDVARFLGTIDLPRALKLMDGAKPANPAEADLVRRLGRAS
jgi:hypothetical protein